MSDEMSSPPKSPCEHSQCLQSGQNRPYQQQDPQSQCPQPQRPLSPCSYSPCSPPSGVQMPCPPQECPPPQGPQQQNSPASNLQSQVTPEQYSLHQCPIQPCSLQSQPQPQLQWPQPQCPHSPSSYSLCSPASRVQSPCPTQQCPPPQSPPKSPHQHNAPGSNSQLQIPPEQYSLHQCPLQPCSLQSPPQPQPQCPSSHWSHSQCPPASWGQSCPPQPCLPQNNPPLQSPQQQNSLECNTQHQYPPQQWPPMQNPQTQCPPKPCSLQQYPSQPQYPQTLCSHPECLSRQGSQEQWPQEQWPQEQWPQQQCPHQQSPAPQSPPQQNPMPPSSSPKSSLPSESPEIPPKPFSPEDCSGVTNEKLSQHGSQKEMKKPSKSIDKPKMTYYCEPVSRGNQKFQTPYKGWGSLDTNMVRDESDKPVSSLQAPPAQVSLPGLLKSSHSCKAEPSLPPKVISSNKSSKPCPRDRAASKAMTPHQKARATLKCAMKDLICHTITKTQDAITAISDESIRQFQKLKKSFSSSNCELDGTGKPKKVSNIHSDTSLRTISVVNLANDPCKSEKEKEKAASGGQSESNPMKILIDKVDSVVSLMNETLGVEIQNPLKGPWRSFNDQSSKYDVPKPPPQPKKVENILNPITNLNLLSSIKERFWSMFADDDKTSELSKKSSTTTLSSESDADGRPE